MKVNNKVIVVTGGANGIGRQIVLQLLHKGARVAIVDKDEAGMKETTHLAGEMADRLSTHSLDITSRQEVEAFPPTVIEAHGTVDGVVNNAGIIQPMVMVKDLDYDKIKHIISTNFYGALHMVRAFLPYLLERSEAHILNVSSMGALVPVPGQTVYGASKAAVKLLTEGLYAELKDTHVHVTLVFPGAVKTNIAANSGVEMDVAGAQDTKIKMLEPEKAAELIIRAMEQNKYRALIGRDARMMDWMSRLSPKMAVNMIYKQMKSLLG